MVQDIKDVVTWLKNWFYDEGEIDTKLSAKANKNLTTANANVVTDASGDITTEAKPVIPDVSGFIDTAGTGLSKSSTTLNHSNSVTALTTSSLKKIKHDAQGHITETANVSGSDLPSHSHSLDNVDDDQVYTYITPSGSTIRSTFSAIDNAIGDLSSIKAIDVVSTLPTASASTMGKLYIISENSKVNVYYTEQTGSGSSATYSWHKMDTDILDELSISYADITNKPSYTPTIVSTDTGAYKLGSINISGSNVDIYGKDTAPSHTHGQVTNDGQITSTAVTVASADNIVITDASDSSKVKRVANLLTDHIKDGTSHSNIGSSQNATQSTINTAIDTAISNRITSIALIPKGNDPTADAYNGVIKLYYGDEPT